MVGTAVGEDQAILVSGDADDLSVILAYIEFLQDVACGCFIVDPDNPIEA